MLISHSSQTNPLALRNPFIPSTGFANIRHWRQCSAHAIPCHRVNFTLDVALGCSDGQGRSSIPVRSKDHREVSSLGLRGCSDCRYMYTDPLCSIKELRIWIEKQAGLPASNQILLSGRATQLREATLSEEVRWLDYLFHKLDNADNYLDRDICVRSENSRTKQ